VSSVTTIPPSPVVSTLLGKKTVGGRAGDGPRRLSLTRRPQGLARILDQGYPSGDLTEPPPVRDLAEQVPLQESPGWTASGPRPLRRARA